MFALGPALSVRRPTHSHRPRAIAPLLALGAALALAGCGGAHSNAAGCAPNCGMLTVHVSLGSGRPAKPAVTELVLRGSHGIAAGSRLRSRTSSVRLDVAPGSYTLGASIRTCHGDCAHPGRAVRCSAPLRLTAGRGAAAIVTWRPPHGCTVATGAAAAAG